MKFYLLDTGAGNGIFNMQTDVDLAKHCNDDEIFLRFYIWNPYCISLGANQSLDDINLKLAVSDNLDVVKRPTGGRAILHAGELTYSFVIPVSFGLGAREVYEKVSRSLVNGLRMYHPKLSEVYLEPDQINFRDKLNKPEGALCFASTAQNEIKFDGKKLVGSAQRKLNHTILQHGSILIGPYHRQLVKYINSAETELSLNQNTIEIESIINDEVDLNILKESLEAGFEQTWGVKFQTEKTESTQDLSSQVLSQV